MTEYKEKKSPRSRVKNSSYMSLVVFFCATVLCSAGFYIYIKQTSPEQSPRQTATESRTLENPGTENTSETQEIAEETADAKNNDTETYTQPSEKVRQSVTAPFQPTFSETGKTKHPESSESASAEDAYVRQLVTEINTFYEVLDSRTYMKRYYLDKPSKEYFSILIQKLVDNPPVVSRETDDLFTLLKNTAHFFRILGKENILMLKGILDREKKSFEKVLRSFYSLTTFPEILEKEYSLSLPADSLYDYAGFFLTTMGGRLYLFRRDSTSRMAVSFYAILIVDRFKDAGSDHHGLDLAQPINSLIEEIENAGKRLRLKEEYLDILYDLKEKYSRL